MHVLQPGLELELVALFAAQEVEARAAARDRVANDVREQHEPGRERGALGGEAGVVEADGAVPLEAHEGGDRPPGGFEEPERDAIARGEGRERRAEEALHPLVHELGLAHARAAVQREEVAEPRRHGVGAADDDGAPVGGFTLEASDLAGQLVAVLSGERGEVGLPGRRQSQDRGSQAGGVGHGVPGGGLRRIEVVGALDLHRSSDGPAVPGDSPPASAGVSSPASPASVIASSTAESKSSPSSSPNSLPIFFMKRATLVGSPSSRSPSPPPSASDSRRASSDFTVAKRDISRLTPFDPQRGHAGGSADERLRTSRLTRRRQSWHSYS